MRRLDTIQTKEKLNNVYTLDEIGPGGANHHYCIVNKEVDDACSTPIQYGEIVFQKGPRKEAGSQHGVIDPDLLEIVRDRLKAFQAGPFASVYNEQALYHIEQALFWMNRRVEDRIARNVLGKNEK